MTAVPVPDPLILGAFFAALGAASYQEVRWRSTLNALTAAMAALAAAHVASAWQAGAAAAPPLPLPAAAMLAAVAAAMLGLLRLAGMYGTADWIALASLFAVLLPAGLHLSVLSVLAALALSCLHSASVCLASNLRAGRGGDGCGRGGCGGGRWGVRALARDMSGGRGGWLAEAAALVSRKRRSGRDRWAYDAGPPAGAAGGGSGRAASASSGPGDWRGPRGGALLGPRDKGGEGGEGGEGGARYVSPSIPVLAHSCAASAALLAVIGP